MENSDSLWRRLKRDKPKGKEEDEILIFVGVVETD